MQSGSRDAGSSCFHALIAGCSANSTGRSVMMSDRPVEFAEHPAIKAWKQLEPASLEPDCIATLEEEEKSGVYRLGGLGRHGSSVIAKRCRRETGLIERTIYEHVLP